MPTSTSFVVEFIKGRPELEARCRKIANDPFKAPEGVVELLYESCMFAFREVEVTEGDGAGFDHVHGSGPVDWDEVVAAFRESKP